MDNLTSVLMNLDSAALSIANPVTPSESTSSQADSATVPAEPESPEAEPETEALAIDPYIDTPMCTTCNECIEKNKQMFKYNGDKMAYIADASAGSYRQLVEAAEASPVGIIHPGTPLNQNEDDLPELMERAKEFS